MKTINLEDVLKNTFPEEESGYSYESLNDVTKAYINKSMLEFGNQLLELAVENADFVMDTSQNDLSIYIDKETILKTIKQIV
jgi:hypothetical protein